MNTHTTEQLLMCEKSDLVKYIEELRGDEEKLKKQLETMSECNDAGMLCDTNGDCIHNLKEQLKEQKELTESFCKRSQKKSNVITKTLDAIVETCRIRKGTTAMSMIQSIHAHDELYKIVSYNLTALQKENEKLKIDYSMNTQYWNCYLSYADPKADMLPEKEHIDDWCDGRELGYSGDVEDWRLKEYLYDQFCIDEDEE